ncbi:nucleoside-diphosphate-sugar epimerase [Candidatus Roizmanbacteria bacterium CG_4_9_14_0_2_um_filter_39_13]|uniref:Nucleoside-diphosphate-sugar epimerase n=1 Tax=Candidatus Roizmanbacteria bacterium CG_4_9_14_0_2_um_filter_39_13 TaxID=1974839 RepID=A0A2M8EW99_9BACT|nr:MAG: nucleoside-diphosphate-sugar epimerase [Candidatus Roizmanbacteria bacterium CG_4_9_14_0_2_um_filter_39_13]
MNILVTGGAGFIGSYLVDTLIAQGNKVRIYDNLEPQVHQGHIPDYLNKDAEFIQGDVNNREMLDKALTGIDVIFHEAAMVGVGQSMYEIAKYTNANTMGTAVLLDLVVNKHRDHIRKLVVAASMSEYGEGLYTCQNCGDLKPDLRREIDMKEGDWDPFCSKCKTPLSPKPTPETTPLQCNSIYAINKRDQEDMTLNIGCSFQIPVVALRYFNVFGPRQSLSNPYTGVAAIFMSRLKANHNPVVFEDGKQSRDFVSVHDIVSANIAVMQDDRANYQIFNVGSGSSISIGDLGKLIIKITGSNQTLDINNKYRKGDIRHCFADISKITKTLGWKPQVALEDGLKELIEWSKDKKSEDLFEESQKILKAKGVV